jgi:hypothetical protein
LEGDLLDIRMESQGDLAGLIVFALGRWGKLRSQGRRVAAVDPAYATGQEVCIGCALRIHGDNLIALVARMRHDALVLAHPQDPLVDLDQIAIAQRVAFALLEALLVEADISSAALL